MIQPVFLSLFLSLFLLAVLWLGQWCRCHESLAHAKAVRCSVLPRCLKPRSPLDCPACCGSSSHSSTQRPASPVPPWSEVKSRRGARHPRADARVCLSQSSRRVLWDQ
jgi:hypothetical protein